MTLRAIAEIVVPETRQLDETEWRAFEEIIERALSQRPKAMRRQLALFIRVLNLRCIARHGRSLSKIDLASRTEFLESVQNSQIMLFRRGFWGVRTLIFMGFYARSDVGAQIGYAAQKLGWQAR